MNRWSRLAFWCAVIAMGGGMVLAKAQQSKEAALIAGDHPVTVEQVLEKLKAEGWSDVVIARDGKYLKVTGILNGQTGNVAVDSQTGRLKVNANDDDDDGFLTPMTRRRAAKAAPSPLYVITLRCLRVRCPLS